MKKLSLLALALALAQQTHAGEVHSLDEAPGQITTPEGKAFFSREMMGKPAPDDLGAHLPPGLSAKVVGDLLTPADDKQPRTLVGARPWPVRPDSFVAIVCTGGATPMGDDLKCIRADDGAPPLHVYLGVIEMKAGSAPRLIARTGSVATPVNWADSGLSRAPMAADDVKDSTILPDSYDRFDLAAYKLAPDVPAFGLRGAWTESYSGGGASFGSLALFALDGDGLTPVLSAPMSAYSDVAGAWHKDQTRDHTITDMANVLVVSKNASDGRFDLLLKNRKGQWRRTFRWSKTAERYQPAGK